ncbi:MAG: PilN domain-containing protein [Candidatus Moranbacteria bacterium]|nr:PilN domain-containing protein [Candidatus Moranbacteria bacterium]
MKIYLDLLPKEIKTELKRKKRFRRILHEEFLFLLPLVLFIVILGNIYYLLMLSHNTSVAAKSQAESQDKYQELSSYEKKFKEVNDNSAKLLKIQSLHLYWANIFNKVGTILPDGISITNFSTKDFQIFLVGKARNRDTLLNFKAALESETCFANINVPLSNLVVKENIDFQMDLTINKDCLKKQ